MTAALIKSRKSKSGLAAGSLVHIGDKRSTPPVATLITYNASSFSETALPPDDPCLVPQEDSVSWINIDGLHDISLMQRLGDCFGIHPLVMEDILNTDQRPKSEEDGKYLYVVLKMFSLKEDDRIAAEQISLVLGDRYLLSFQEGLAGDPFEALRERIRNGRGRIRTQQADFLAYALLDSIVDGYFVVLEKIGDAIEAVEDELMGQPTKRTLVKLQRLRREILVLRRFIWPLREVVGALERGDSDFFRPETRPYLRDLYDHTIQIVDTIDTCRDIMAGMLDIYLSSVANRTNDVMRVLTVIATIFMPLTFIVGVYGMNFQYMPELQWRWGYPVLWVLMIGLGLSMVLFFRRKKWL